MQQQTAAQKIRKSPLMRNILKLLFIRRIRLDAQTGGENELADCGAEAGEEGVEGLFFFCLSATIACFGGKGN